MTTLDHNTEKEIIGLIQKGSLYAYELIFRRYYVSLCGFATRFVHQPEIAEEIVQNVFLKLWERRATLSIETSLKSYLFRAIYNGCNNHLVHTKVKNKYLSLAQDAALRQQSLSDPVLDSLTYKELDESITQSIEALPEECKRIFKMSRFDGLKYAEIADQLGISIKTVETQISRALARLREDLRDFLVKS